MSFYDTYRSTYLKFDPKSPRAAGVCDYTGIVFAHKDLKKQMEWRGDQLSWTGLMVGDLFIDKPQPQNRPPPVLNDPTVIENPRPPQGFQSNFGVQNPPYDVIFAQLTGLHITKSS